MLLLCHILLAAVIRRTGGLEVVGNSSSHRFYVIRRTGGLEVDPRILEYLTLVIRRTGGLEGYSVKWNC